MGHRNPLQDSRDPVRDPPDDVPLSRPIYDPTRDIDIRPTRDDPSQQVRDMASLVSRLASEVLLLKTNNTPPVTADNGDSFGPVNIDGDRRLPSSQPNSVDPPSQPTVSPPVVPIGEPIHPGGGSRPNNKCSVRLETYAGQGASLEAFLAKFEEHARYFQWNEDDRVFNLKNSLTGTAATVLWAGGSNATASKLISLLKDQHGTENQLERFWLELYARRRKPSESLQELYQDIRRLISLACPNDKSDTSERLAINQFTTALDNENIRFEVLNHNPSKLETALHIAMRYEALKPEHSAPLGSSSPAGVPRAIDASTFIYDDKGRKKEGLRAHELHVSTTSEVNPELEIERTRNHEAQRKVIDLQHQLESWRSWHDEQTRAQAASMAGNSYSQPYSVPTYSQPYSVPTQQTPTMQNPAQDYGTQDRLPEGLPQEQPVQRKAK